MTAQAQRQAKAWAIIALLFCDRAIGIRTTDETDDDFFTEDSDLDQGSEAFKESLDVGAQVEAGLTCDNLPAKMVQALSLAVNILKPLCGDEACFEKEGLPDDSLVEVSALIGALAGKADEKFCLGATMQDPLVSHAVADVLNLTSPILMSGESDDANAHLKEAYSRLLSWQRMMLNLASTMTDRQALFPRDIANHCPAPCSSCTPSRRGFWWRRVKISKFSFQCILKKRPTVTPNVSSYTCGKVERHRLFWYKTKCDVIDWVTMACQQTRIASVLECGVTSFNQAASGTWDDDWSRTRKYEDCIRSSPRNTLKNRANEQRFANRRAAPQDSIKAMGVLLTLGMATGIAVARLEASMTTDGDDDAEAADVEEGGVDGDQAGGAGEDGEDAGVMDGPIKEDVDPLTAQGLVELFQRDFNSSEYDEVYDATNIFTCGSGHWDSRDQMVMNADSDEICGEMSLFVRVTTALIVTAGASLLLSLPWGLMSAVIRTVLSIFSLGSAWQTLSRILSGAFAIGTMIYLATSKINLCLAENHPEKKVAVKSITSKDWAFRL